MDSREILEKIKELSKEEKRRDTELSRLLNSVNDLSSIFKDMQNLVMEQGSILDRIDYNIDMASINVVKGKNSLIKANEYHKNNCFRNVIIVILVCIFIESLMLIFKFINWALIIFFYKIDILM